MVSKSIKIYARIKKEVANGYQHYDVARRQEGSDDIFIYSNISHKLSSSKFRFNHVFDQSSDQEQLFDVIAKPIIHSVLQGFNSTIFAYGQTGSGKTYSMTGSSRKYKFRGIIPRSLEYIFSITEQEEDKPSLYISYVEIYKEVCYDLLKFKDKRIALKLEDLPKVVILEDRNAEAHLRNINILPVHTEEEAMRLLFLGETNRVIAETPLNEYSSRSHCIFTIHFGFRGKDSDAYIKSKLNFVDLAGSERVSKTKNTGSTLTEAKFINRSLHFLQQVILALSESKRSHVPYRNSTLTFMLKDSLGGNCITAMLATLSFAAQHIQESISTCIFAQRVAAIKTEPIINEIKHPQQEINMLRDEIRHLKRQLSQQNISYASTASVKDISEEDKLKCDKFIETFINNDDNTDINIDKKFCGYYLVTMKNKIQSLQIELQKLQKMNEHNLGNTDGEKGVLSQKSVKNSAYSTHKLPPQVLKHSEDIQYYEKLLEDTLSKAKLYNETITFCQRNINCIIEKINICSKRGDNLGKAIQVKDLEYQQTIYKQSINELRRLKNETIMLEAGLNKAKQKYNHDAVENRSCFKGNGCEQSSKQACICQDNYPDIREQFYSAKDCRTPEYDTCRTCCSFLHSQCDSYQQNCCCLNAYPENFSYPLTYIPQYTSNISYHNKCLITTIEEDPDVEEQTQNKAPASKPSNAIELKASKPTLDPIQLIPDKLEKEIELQEKVPSPNYQECTIDDNIPNETVKLSDAEADARENNVCGIFLSTDNDNFKEFMKTVPLTGVEDVDREICGFYRCKFS